MSSNPGTAYLSKSLDDSVIAATNTLRDLMSQRHSKFTASASNPASTPGSILNSSPPSPPPPQQQQQQQHPAYERHLVNPSLRAAPLLSQSAAVRVFPTSPQAQYSSSQRDALCIVGSDNVDALALQNAKIERIIKKISVLSDKFKTSERDDVRTQTTIQKNEEIIKQLIDSQKTDKQVIGALRKEVYTLQKSLAEVVRRDAQRTEEMNRMLSTGSTIHHNLTQNQDESKVRYDETLLETVRRIVEARVMKEYERIVIEVTQACVSEQARALRSWTETATAAVDQRSSAANEQIQGLQNDVSSLGQKINALRPLTTEKADVSKKIEQLVQRTCTQELHSAMSTLAERFNSSISLVQKEQQVRVATQRAELLSNIEEGLDKVREEARKALSEVVIDADAKQVNASFAQNKLKTKLDEVVSAVCSSSSVIAAMGQSLQAVQEELSRKEKSDMGKEQSLLDMYFNFQDSLEVVNDLVSRVGVIEEEIRNLATVKTTDHNFWGGQGVVDGGNIDESVVLLTDVDTADPDTTISIQSKKNRLRTALRQM